MLEKFLVRVPVFVVLTILSVALIAYLFARFAYFDGYVLDLDLFLKVVHGIEQLQVVCSV
jgi:hypothetical protein